MNIECGLSLDCESLISEEDDFESDVVKVSEFDIIPKEGVYLGLDISEHSSGVCLYNNGEKLVANISLETKESEEFYEVKRRRELKGYLAELIEGLCLDVIVIEDAYQGENAKTTRMLYAINTAIDELILDGVCACNKFVRVSNMSWKSWLYRVDKDNLYKGLKDKKRIEKCLSLLGIFEDGVGYQDRLDACGMVIGYFYYGKDVFGKQISKRVKIEDIVFSYKSNEDFILSEARDSLKSDEVDLVRFNFKRGKVSKASIIDILSSNPSMVCISDEVKLGNLHNTLGIPTIDEEYGYLGFWVNPKKIGKYKAGD